ncbi:thiamine biosynthesis protein ThiS [Clostridium aceticum]|uniref:Thiamine biosynthesis protein ThiS n=1 Tax=Clostridium aceticum TaxID=84022 RepID=A0A0D8IBR3_9CLOT|nr:sulfur carrier protein ThiS [Clostridium aceticum]AKL94794.1 thiamine biosynthesis protein ThiS [Clostridium aceticum]KJF27735.1 sulfur transfer protein involved in thiamine biosynthesis [Clostridium aceticum]
MTIKMNGEEKQLEKEMNILEFLAVQQVEMPEMVSVELNGEIIDRDDFETIFIKENDVIELLYFMGGGGFGF